MGFWVGAALLDDGKMVAWNVSGGNVLKEMTNVKAIASASTYVMALKDDGTAYVIVDTGEMRPVFTTSENKAISCGWDYMLVLKNNGLCETWGNNGYGECNIPDGLSGVISIAAGDHHTAVLTEDGNAYVWGKIDFDGEGSINKPITGVKSISAGRYNTVIVKEDGTIEQHGEVDFILPALTEDEPSNAITGYISPDFDATGLLPSHKLGFRVDLKWES
jgi:alpha-tubulin suppressor-like RCC1 family protein